MARVSRTPFVVLGLLALSDRKPRSGYEIKKAIDTVISSVWHESDGQLYPTLKILEASGDIAVCHEVKQGRRKTLYAITPEGRKRLQDWLAAPVELGRPRNELILKLFFGSEADVPDLIRHVEDHQRRAQAGLAQCRVWEKESANRRDRYRPFVHLTIQAGIRLAEAELLWANDTLQALTAMKPKSKTS